MERLLRLFGHVRVFMPFSKEVFCLGLWMNIHEIY